MHDREQDERREYCEESELDEGVGHGVRRGLCFAEIPDIRYGPDRSHDPAFDRNRTPKQAIEGLPEPDVICIIYRR